MPERGEFTRKFDRDILGDETASEEERQARRRVEEAENEALDREFNKVLSILDYRASWLKERFAGCKETGSAQGRGRRFEFFDEDEKSRGWIEFRTRLTDSQQGITIESFMEMPGHFPRKHDYVNFPKENVKIDRAKRFVESKLMEFAGPYQDAFGGG